MDKIASQVAANIYGNTAKIGSSAGASAPKADGLNFGALLEKTARSTVDTMKASERVSAQAVTGDADLNDVVSAVTSAEITLQTVVAVRDRLVSALQEIVRMPM